MQVKDFFKTYWRYYLLLEKDFLDTKRYYEAFDAYYVKKDLSAMTKLFAEYLNARLDEYLKILVD